MFLFIMHTGRKILIMFRVFFRAIFQKEQEFRIFRILEELSSFPIDIPHKIEMLPFVVIVQHIQGFFKFFVLQIESLPIQFHLIDTLFKAKVETSRILFF